MGAVTICTHTPMAFGISLGFKGHFDTLTAGVKDGTTHPSIRGRSLYHLSYSYSVSLLCIRCTVHSCRTSAHWVQFTSPHYRWGNNKTKHFTLLSFAAVWLQVHPTLQHMSTEPFAFPFVSVLLHVETETRAQGYWPARLWLGFMSVLR